MDPRQQINLPLPMLLPRRAMCSLRGVTSAKRGRWAESGLVWLGRDRLVGVLKRVKKENSAPTRTAQIAQAQARVAHATICGRREVGELQRIQAVDAHFQIDGTNLH